MNEATPRLAGPLPPECQQDLNALHAAVYETVSKERPAEAVPPSAFRRVLLTGATGFVGRFMLREILAHKADLEVFCLVRADDAEHGRERLRAALERAELWDDAFASRIHVVTGDVEHPRLGLSESDFDDLCLRIDAVYHLAASLNLATSYAAIRQANVASLVNLMELCLRGRFKHFFYASTMGIFPEYFCTFANEFIRSRIEHQMQPNLAVMKRIFPLGLIGYPWSKLVAEQGLLFAQTAGLPLAIFRLPQTGLSASTGYTQSSDIKVRLAMAVMEQGLAPRGFPTQWSEPVDAVSGYCVDISMNPQRRFTIYHCCNPHPVDHGIELGDFGFKAREVSYTEFKQTCLARGEQHPLHGHWGLIDHFAPWWFSSSRTRGHLPISDRSLQEDSTQPIEWPGMVTTHGRSFEWVVRHQDQWPYELLHAGLSFDQLFDRAEHYARRADLPLDLSFPEWVQEGLQQLVQSINASSVPLLDARKANVCFQFCRILRSNAALAAERRSHAEIEQEPIAQPLFILGPNRTGTTLLHRLLARDERFQTLRSYEINDPVLPAADYASVAGTAADPRRLLVEDLFAASRISELLGGVHDIGTDDPEEDFGLLQRTFASWTYLIFYRAPGYGEWLAATGSDRAYAHHRGLMQHFSWHRQQRRPGPRPQWLLKMPFHLMELESLLRAYPDARFIMTHREPRQFMGSWCSLVSRLRTLTIGELPPEETGAEELAFMSNMLDRAVQFRDAHPEIEDRWIDVNYVELIEDPLDIVQYIYEQLHSEPLDPAVESDMSNWMFDQAQLRRGQLRHRYSLGEYGLTPEATNAAFERYREFTFRKGLRSRRR